MKRIIFHGRWHTPLIIWGPFYHPINRFMLRPHKVQIPRDICFERFDRREVRFTPLQWRHNERDGVSNHQPHDCLLNHSFRCRSNKTSESKLRVTGFWEGNSPVTGEFPAQRASNAVNVSIGWRHHVIGAPSQLISPWTNWRQNYIEWL